MTPAPSHPEREKEKCPDCENGKFYASFMCDDGVERWETGEVAQLTVERKGTWFLDTDGYPVKCETPTIFEHPILEPLPEAILPSPVEEGEAFGTAYARFNREAQAKKQGEGAATAAVVADADLVRHMVPASAMALATLKLAQMLTDQRKDLESYLDGLTGQDEAEGTYADGWADCRADVTRFFEMREEQSTGTADPEAVNLPNPTQVIDPSLVSDSPDASSVAPNPDGLVTVTREAQEAIAGINLHEARIQAATAAVEQAERAALASSHEADAALSLDDVIRIAVAAAEGAALQARSGQGDGSELEAQIEKLIGEWEYEADELDGQAEQRKRYHGGNGAQQRRENAASLRDRAKALRAALDEGKGEA